MASTSSGWWTAAGPAAAAAGSLQPGATPSLAGLGSAHVQDDDIESYLRVRNERLASVRRADASGPAPARPPARPPAAHRRVWVRGRDRLGSALWSTTRTRPLRSPARPWRCDPDPGRGPRPCRTLTTGRPLCCWRAAGRRGLGQHPHPDHERGLPAAGSHGLDGRHRPGSQRFRCKPPREGLPRAFARPAPDDGS